MQQIRLSRAPGAVGRAQPAAEGPARGPPQLSCVGRARDRLTAPKGAAAYLAPPVPRALAVLLAARAVRCVPECWSEAPNTGAGLGAAAVASPESLGVQGMFPHPALGPLGRTSLDVVSAHARVRHLSCRLKSGAHGRGSPNWLLKGGGTLFNSWSPREGKPGAIPSTAICRGGAMLHAVAAEWPRLEIDVAALG